MGQTADGQLSESPYQPTMRYPHGQLMCSTVLSFDEIFLEVKNMASHEAYLAYVLEQLSEVDGITYRPMMGEYLLYCGGKLIGGIYDDRFLLKPTPSAIRQLPQAPLDRPYEGAKEMLLVENLDNKSFLKDLLETMREECPAPSTKKKHRKTP